MSTETATTGPTIAETPAAEPAATFTRMEQRALRALRTRYQEDRDLFSAGELARLLFLRWLHDTGHLDEGVRR